MNRLQELVRCGQAIWLDYIRRDLLQNGELAALIAEDGVSGLTSNPAIFEQAIGQSDLYDGAMREILAGEPDIDGVRLYERLAIDDIRMAADLLAGVFRDTGGADGYVSLEVSPHLAADTGGTLEEARRLWAEVDRPNLMIKVPATSAGIDAIEALIGGGINVNVTLMFSLEHYEAVAQAYLRGLAGAEEPSRVASVASFFVSRVDTAIDKQLAAATDTAAAELLGAIGIANSKMAYQRFLEIFHGADFESFAARGARPQRVLWASTSTKNEAYRDVLYVEELIGAETVNTIPPKTLAAFRDHGEAAATLTEGIAEARGQLDRLTKLGIDLRAVTEELQRDGLAKFAVPFDRLLAALEAKRTALAASSASVTV